MFEYCACQRNVPDIGNQESLHHTLINQIETSKRLTKVIITPLLRANVHLPDEIILHRQFCADVPCSWRGVLGADEGEARRRGVLERLVRACHGHGPSESRYTRMHNERQHNAIGS